MVRYLAGCGLQSCPLLISKGYPDIGWNPVEGERYLDFLRFAVFCNGRVEPINFITFSNAQISLSFIIVIQANLINYHKFKGKFVEIVELCETHSNLDAHFASHIGS